MAFTKTENWKQGILKGEFLFGKRAGIWIYEDLSKKKTDEEIYERGKLVKRIHFSEPTTVELNYKKEIIISVNSLVTEAIAYDHNSFTNLNQVFEQQTGYPVSFHRPVTYPGGTKRLLLLLAQYAEIPEGNVTILRLKVDEHGNVLKYGIEESAGPENDNQAMKAIKVHENKFLPAIKDGKPYSSTIFLPISGGQNWINFLNTTPIEEVLMIR